MSAGPPPLRRVLLAGICGAGKTTLARRLAEHRGLRHIEVDALHHGPGWRPRPAFLAELDALTSADGWIADSCGHPEAAELLWPRADTVVWLDLPRRQVMLRVLRRSLGRTLRREALWHGNRETLAAWFTARHPARIAWTRYAARRREIAARLGEARPPVHLVHLGSARQADAWLRRLLSEGPSRR